MIEVKYEGKKISLNKWYVSHWSFRKNKKEEIINDIEIVKDDVISGSFKIEMEYNSRNDVENNVPLLKVVTDYLRRSGRIEEDNTKYYKELNIKFNPQMKKNTYIISISKI